MRVVRLTLAYDGTGFHGWARQPGRRTVEGVLGQTIRQVLGTHPRLSAAGRTDAGVHARGQVASFPAADSVEPGRLQRSLNGMLGPEVVVTRAAWAAEGFDARLSARARVYRFTIDTATWPDPFVARFVWHRPGELSVARMRRAARDLVGTHDFASFARRRPGDRSMVRDLRRLTVSRSGTVVAVTAEANGFLQQMVRSLVGTLVDVSEGRLDPASMPGVLAARDRSAAGRIAPPLGLVLEAVRYG